jgi:cytochrome c553
MLAIPLWRACIVLAVVGLSLAYPFPKGGRPKKPKQPVTATPVARVDFDHDVKPILAERCIRCHGSSVQEAGLRLDTAAAIRKGSNSGAVIVPRDSAKSLLIAVVTGEHDRISMPPTGERLNDQQVSMLRAWIDAGAIGTGQTESDTVPPQRVEHWSYQTIQKPVVPEAPNGNWTRNPIDAFNAAEHRLKGLTPVTPASRAHLLRRVMIDLTGLPPTRPELQAFLADQSSDAYEKVVDRLLASPRYGERWARHWMDIWRYSEGDGRKAKADIWWSSAHLWRWRDWIVASLNRDAGYDQMIREMLAGDELTPTSASLAATGFLVRNYFKLDRNIWLNGTVDHTAKAFLGVNIACARCHDHKYDPISQKEYYQFRAFFETHDIQDDPLAAAPGLKVNLVARANEARSKDPTYIYLRGDPKTPDKETVIRPGVPAALGGPPIQIIPFAATASTGRRTALGRWMTDRSNPLTARVAVNHMWAWHFGRPLVDSVADFGKRTPAPAAQALLDWLASEFMDKGWSMKAINRLIVTSATYRLHSSSLGSAPENEATDPENQYYWRMNSQRMEAEVIRDSLLWLGGALDETMGGPPIDFALGEDTGRRSLYYRYSREDKMSFLTVFDAPGVEECYQRQKSIVPQQALALENSAFVWEQARRIAQRLRADASIGRTDSDFVNAAFEHVLGRSPSAAEAAACLRFLSNQTTLLADRSRLTEYPPLPPPAPPDPEVVKRVPGLPLVLGEAKKLPPVVPTKEAPELAREYFIHALLNHNDFITVR